MAPLSEASKRALSRLRTYKATPTAWHSMPVSRRAAVLILLFPDNQGDLRVVLTMRASTLSSYSGHAALAGGKADNESESPFEVARREAEEEIGLPRKRGMMPKGFWVEELCEMPTNLAKTELLVRPCVAMLHNSGRKGEREARANSDTAEMDKGDSKTTDQGEGDEDEGEVEGGSVEENMLPRLDAREVAAVFSAPFKNFLYTEDLPVVASARSPSVHGGDQSQRADRDSDSASSIPHGKWYEGSWTDWHQQRWRMHNFFVPVTNQKVHRPRKSSRNSGQQATVDQLDGLSRYRVWGMTARILVDAARYAYEQEPEFEHNSHFGDEGMIARLRKLGKLGDIRRPGEVLTREDMRKAANL